jgi:hypothetical protein
MYVLFTKEILMPETGPVFCWPGRREDENENNGE